MPSLATIKSKPLRWLWPNHFPLGKLSLIIAEQGQGKSFLALDLAARVSAGKPWPLLPETPNPAGGVLILTAADDLPDIVCPRLAAAAADLNQISAPEFAEPADDHHKDDHDNDENPAPPFDFAALEQEIKSMPNCRLVIIDPLSEFLPPTKNNRKQRPDWPVIFKALAAIAARAAIVATLSFIPSTSAAANHRAVATLAAHPGPACVWRIAQDQQQENLRHLLPIKNNLAPRNAPLSFELTSHPDQPTAIITWKDALLRVPLALPDSKHDASSAAPESPPPAPSQLPTPNSELPTPNAGKPQTNTEALKFSAACRDDNEQETISTPHPQPPCPEPEPAVATASAWLVHRLKSCGGQQRASTIRRDADFKCIPAHILTLAKDHANIQATPTDSPPDELWKLPERG